MECQIPSLKNLICILGHVSPSQKGAPASLPSVCVCVCTPCVSARQRFNKSVPAATNAGKNKKLLQISDWDSYYVCQAKKNCRMLVFCAVHFATRESRRTVFPSICWCSVYGLYLWTFRSMKCVCQQYICNEPPFCFQMHLLYYVPVFICTFY
jgi:hypothetical protein